ncbi:MAG: glycolate oxidase subunit GlcF [Proteobacteria bacterium]|nr:glycolate oxidase subunit GlcF [Pseudomonadota bacterium]
MKTSIHPDLAALPDVQAADSILRNCVHCGFCNATCPTYQELGDELDGPRGRIYLIKNLLEDNRISAEAVTHLDRCLTCRACETTCPSGVQYGQLIDIGRGMAEQYAERSRVRQTLSWLMRLVIPRRWLFKPLLRTGQLFRPLLPAALKSHVPARQQTLPPLAASDNPRVLLLTGCVQSAATPGVVTALQRLLAKAGRPANLVDEGCCGALDYHLGAHEAGRAHMRRVIDQLLPELDQVDAVLSSATGCGVTLAEYPRYLEDDPVYAARAQRLADKCRDAVSYLAALELPVPASNGLRVAVHTPCSMQHGLKLNGQVEKILERLGYTLVPHAEGHLCCGSAGSYSILEPALSERLQRRKIRALQAGKPDVIVTANIGCQLHLGAGADVPVIHWLELVAADLS